MNTKAGFPSKKIKVPTIKSRAKFVKKVAVPKSAKVVGNKVPSWGKGKN